MAKRSKKEILERERSKRKTKVVYIDEWDSDITIRTLKADETFQIQETMVDGKTNREYYFTFVALSIVDDNGKPEYTVDEVKEFDTAVINRILIEIAGLNGLGEDAINRAKAELKKAIESSTSS